MFIYSILTFFFNFFLEHSRRLLVQQENKKRSLEQELAAIKQQLKGEVTKETIELALHATKCHLRYSARYKSLRIAFANIQTLESSTILQLTPAQKDVVELAVEALEIRLWAAQNEQAKKEFPALLKWWRKVKPEYQKYAITVIRKTKGRKQADSMRAGTLLQKTEFLRLAKVELTKLQAEIAHQENRWRGLSEAERTKIKFAIKKQTNTDPKVWWNTITVLERITVLRRMMDELLGSERDEKSKSL